MSPNGRMVEFRRGMIRPVARQLPRSSLIEQDSCWGRLGLSWHYRIGWPRK